MSRKVTMNDLFADPTDDDGGSSSSKAATLNKKFAHGTRMSGTLVQKKLLSKNKRRRTGPER